MAKVDYKFVSEFMTTIEKNQRDVESYAGRLLEITGAPTLIITLDNDNRPFVYWVGGRMSNAMDVICDAELPTYEI
ncbi:hypothetical protein [Anaerotignum propionicum]|uniref:hypothetical protein n=1 Tax=Anaerotignum propionicum TaxID=28446 RepID=UPI00289FBFA5|nr:hypothetical protein [Anaerotignum propionicum]